LYIEDQAFAKCSSLSSIAIPASVERIGDGCFSECRALFTVKFDDESHLSWIGHSVFCRCSSLLSIRIPSSLETVFSRYQAFLEITGRIG
jgi:hypothetical protein